MSGNVWDGKEWERHVHSLLVLHHRDKGDDYQPVPDTHGGDLGIEGFSRTARTVYQSYAPQEPLSVSQRYEKHRVKITTDIGKFVRNEKEIAATLGDAVRIRSWVLVVPVHDSKQLVKHATKKQAEVRSKKCCHIDSRNFQVLIKDHSAFPLEEAALAASGAKKIALSPPPDQGAAERDLAEAGALVARATDKLEGRIASGVDDIVRDLLLAFFRAENILADIRESYPELSSRIRDFDVGFEYRVQTESILSVGEPRKRLGDVLDLYRTRLSEVLPNLPGTHMELMVTGKVGDLLGRCPLHFGDAKKESS
ncbi:MAG: hypothetical protein RLO52_10770 [Sandaracinaceae bacterium]